MSIQPYIGDEAVEQYCDDSIIPAYAEAKKPLDRYYADWPARAVYDHGVGNLSWAASCAKHLRECRDALGLPKPPLPPWPMPSGDVKLVGRMFADDSGPFLALGKSLFWAWQGMVHEPERVGENVRWLRSHGVQAVRVLSETTDWAVEKNRCDPRTPEWKPAGHALFAVCASVGMRISLTLFGGNQLTFGEQRQATLDALDICEAWREQVFDIEISNEAQGFLSPEGINEMRALADLVTARGFLVSLTSVDHQKGINDGSNVPIGTIHPDRTYGENGWRYVRQPWGYYNDYGQVPKAWVNREPCGIGSSGCFDDDPVRQAGAAILSWMIGAGMYVIHTGAGVYGVPNPVSATNQATGKGETLMRPANVWEQPTLEPMLRIIAEFRNKLPSGVANWERQNHGWPGHPCNVEPHTVGDDALAANLGCTRAYAATHGTNWVCLPIGIMGHMTLAPKQGETWTCWTPSPDGSVLTRLDGQGATETQPPFALLEH